MNEWPVLVLVLQCLHCTGPERTVDQYEIYGTMCPHRRQNIKEGDLCAHLHSQLVIVTGNGSS